MKNHTSFSSKAGRRSGQRNQRGIALVTTLLLLMLLTAMSLTMVLSVGSDMLVNGYYGNERGSFYAADSGANIARQAVTTAILAQVPANFAATTQPIPAGTNTNVQTSVGATYSGYTSLNTANSWPEKFQIPANGLTLGNPTCTVIGGPATVNGAPISCTNLPPAGTLPIVTGFKYIYPYSITVVGQAQGAEATTLFDSGNLLFNGTITPSGGQKQSFAAYGTFIDQYPPCSAPFVAGTLTGPFFTNGAWNFGDANALGSSTKYDFTDTTGQNNGAASYWHGNNCDNNAAASDTNNGTTIAPTFQNGFNLGQNSIALPQNDYNQEQAVLDGIGQSSTAPTNAQLNAVLKNVSGTPYPTGGTGSGVYVPYSINASTGAKTFTGGGIYVQGDATVTLSPTGANGQVYTIVQGGVTTTITTNATATGAGTTTISQGGVNTVINGVPEMIDPTTGAVTENATMLYVNGNITSLQGPAEYQPAINNGVALTVTAAQNVTVTGDIRYATEPVTTANNQVVNGQPQPADTLIPANNTGQVLGIFTATGDIQMNNGNSDSNLEIDASIAMISQGGTGGWINVGPHINTLNVVGGRIANQAKSGNTTTRNIFFDRRFSQGGFAPPWYPSTTLQASGTDKSAFQPPTVQRLQWSYQSATR
jgi:Tfp pilus assembly protein PilX